MALRLKSFASAAVLLLVASPAVIIGAASASAIADAPAQPEALATIEAASPEQAAKLGEADVLLALERGWFDAAKALLRLLRARGEAVASLADVRAKATKIRDEATEVINLMRVGANAEATDVNCAFQWAQRPEFIYLNVKFSSRIDGPVTVLNVDNERVNLGNNSLVFEAVGRQKPKTFKLNLTFFGAILPEQSSWSFASVGRMSFTIAKAVNETWPRLLETKAKPKNMYGWYERQTALDAEVKKESKARKDAKEKEEKVEEKQTTGSENAASDGSKAPPPLSTPPAPPTPPKKKSKKGKAKAAKKDEV